MLIFIGGTVANTVSFICTCPVVVKPRMQVRLQWKSLDRQVWVWMSVKCSMLVCLIESFVESTGELLCNVSKQWNWLELNPNATLRRTVDSDTMWNKWFLVLCYHTSSMTISCLFDQCVIWGQLLITSSIEVAPQLNIVRNITRSWPYRTTNPQWKFYHTIHSLHIRD